MTEKEESLVLSLDRQIKKQNKMQKVVKSELPRLEEALVALKRGKSHVTEAYLADAIEALAGLLED